MFDPLFDTHAHLISDDPLAYPPSPLRGTTQVTAMDYHVTADWLIEQMDLHGVVKAAIVQRGHVYGYDNRYIVDSGKRFPDRLASVVILDSQDAASPRALSRLVKEAGVRGARLAQTRIDFYDTAWLNSPAAMNFWRTAADLEIPVAVISFRRHLSWTLLALKFIAELFPSLPIIIDHVGTPHTLSNPEKQKFIEAGLDTAMPGAPDFGVSETIGIFDELPNVHFKFTEINLDRLRDQGADPAQFIRRLVNRFGAERLMWGSDLGQSEAPYDQKAAMARMSASSLNDDERRAFLFGTANRLYFS